MRVKATVTELAGRRPAGRDVLVTRPESLTGETQPPSRQALARALAPGFSRVGKRGQSELRCGEGGALPSGSVRSTPAVQAGSDGDAHRLQADEQLPFFVDWLSISQEHPAGGLPEVDAGVVLGVDEGGTLAWKTVRAVKHEGSHETSVQVRCDGYRVQLSGNLSRFGRPDNLFGFGWRECIARANAVLAHYGLPPFTAGQPVQRLKGDRGVMETTWTGARISRIDLTANYCAGSMAEAHAVMQYLGSQHAGRKSGRVLGQGETVDFGAGSRRQYWKAYLKALELERHGCGDARLVEWCKSVGLVRWEGTIKSNALNALSCAWLGEFERGWAMGQLVQLFNEHVEVLGRVERSVDELETLPKHLRGTARDYLAGMDLAGTLKKATFYRHRAALLPFGLDISVRNVRPFQPRVQVVRLAPAVAPSWYSLAA